MIVLGKIVFIICPEIVANHKGHFYHWLGNESETICVHSAAIL